MDNSIQGSSRAETEGGITFTSELGQSQGNHDAKNPDAQIENIDDVLSLTPGNKMGAETILEAFQSVLSINNYMSPTFENTDNTKTSPEKAESAEVKTKSEPMVVTKVPRTQGGLHYKDTLVPKKDSAFFSNQKKFCF